jgi:hypothetical protein
MRFSIVLLLALVMGITGGVYHSQRWVPYDVFNLTYGAFVLTGILLLVLFAALSQRLKLGRVDIAAASESIVAYGIASLTGGIGIGLSQAVRVGFKNLETDQMIAIATPFVEGVFIAAIAPVLAAFLRNIDGESAGPITASAAPTLSGMTTGLKGMSDAISSLTKQISEFGQVTKVSSDAVEALGKHVKEQGERLKTTLLEAQTQIKGMASAADSAGGSMKDLHSAFAGLKAPGDDIKTLGNSVASLARQVSVLQDAAAGSTESMESLGKQVREHGNRLKAALQEAESSVQGMTASSDGATRSLKTLGVSLADIKASSEDVRGLGDAFSALKTQTDETARVLKGLRDILAKFRNFIGRDRAALS